jgi:Uma2 family endonuclease
MSAALKFPPPTTLDEFLVWERGQELRYEWDGVQPIAMVGGTFRHTEIASRLYDAVRAALRGGPCSVVRADMKVLTSQASRVRYPDLVVTCAPIPPLAVAVPDPVLIAEVLSDSTAGADLGAKLAEYTALPSLRRYLILDTEDRLALVFARDQAFRRVEVRDVLDVPEFDLRIPLAPLYDGLV